jgi:hypothetical protein
MATDQILTCESISVLEHLSADCAVLSVVFSGGIESIMFADYSECLKFVGQEVIVNFREEIYNNEITTCVNKLTRMTTINTLDRESNIKLYINGLPPIGSTVAFDDIPDGGLVLNAVVYCNSHNYDSSAKASWAVLGILDKNRRSSNLRIFDYERKTDSLAGKYIKCDLRKKEPYGFITTECFEVPEINISPNPEIDLAKNFILEIFKDDKDILDYIAKSSILDFMEKYNYEERIEKGYTLVRTAMEIAMARELANLSEKIDVKLILRALLLRRVYCITNNEKNTMSTTLQNIIGISKYRFSADKRLLMMLESEPKFPLFERKLIDSISTTVDTVIEGTKTFNMISALDKLWRN